MKATTQLKVFLTVVLCFIDIAMFGQNTREQAKLSKTEAKPGRKAYNLAAMVRLCIIVRKGLRSKVHHGYFDFEVEFFKLAGIKDPDAIPEEELQRRVRNLWKEHSKDFYCKIPQFRDGFPVGNFLIQWAAALRYNLLKLMLEYYEFDTNMIDPDGCTVLDFVEAETRSKIYDQSVINRYNEIKKLLIEHGAKHANDLGGKCDIKESYEI